MVPRASALRVSLLAALAAVPVIVLACGDDEAAAPSTGTTVVPDGSAAAPDAVAEAASVAPIVVSLPALGIATNAYVIFYPKESPEAPLSVPLTSALPQTIARVMLQGADVLVVLPSRLGPTVFQFDDVGPGETIFLDGINDTGSPFNILRVVPFFADAGGGDYVFSSCADTVRPVQEDVTLQQLIPGPCRGVDGNARFVATTTSPPLAISTLVSGLALDGGKFPLVTMPAWRTPTPVAWSFTGAPPAGTTVDAKVFATSTGQYGGFELGRFAAVAQGSSLSFVRAPTSFADTELHVVTGQYPPVAAYSSKVVSIERTAASNPVTTDLGALQTHLTGVTVSAASSGTFGLDFTSSGAIPSGTPIISFVSGSPRDQADVTTQWLTFSSMSGAGHVETHALPAEVRANVYVANVDWVPQGIYAVSGIDPRFLRPNALAIYHEVASSDPRGAGFPPGPFSAIVSSLARSAH